MRLKPVIIASILFLTSVSSAYAATDVTGDIYGKTIELMNMTDDGIPYGVEISDIGASEGCDIVAQTCPLRGFSWATRVGWTVWDGTSPAGLQGLLGAGSFPNEYIAKAAFNGNIGGYAWGEKYGWISLSVCNGLPELGPDSCASRTHCQWSTGGHCEVNPTVRVPHISTQDTSDWGVYIDFCPLKSSQAECENVADNSDTYCNWDAVDTACVFDSVSNPNGQPFGGYAWSEYLGWIKFGPETGDTEFGGAFTNWFPDTTPPEDIASIYVPGHSAWIPNESPARAIEWREFVDEDESFVDIDDSDGKVSYITVYKDAAAEFAACPDPMAPGTFTTGNLIINLGPTGEADLVIPQIGDIGFSPPGPPLYGYCKYTLEGVLYNQTGFGHYFGPAGLAQAVLDGAPKTTAPNTYVDDPITIFVRAGDIDPTTISIVPDTNNVVADGNNSIIITFSPVDFGDNPIISVKADIDGNPIPGDPDNWIRNVEFLYDLDSSLYTFDSIDWLRDFALGNPLPVDIEGYAAYTHGAPLQYPPGGLGYHAPVGGSYLMELTGYAPTTTVGNTLEISQIDFNTNDEFLPAISPMQGPWPANFVPTTLTSGTPAPLFTYNFEPVLEVTDGYLNTDFLAINQPAEATFTFENDSIDTLSEYSFDNLLYFHDASFGAELLEVQDINEIFLSDETGRTDPNGPGSRYGLVYSGSATYDASNNLFHSLNDNYHDPVYSFENSPDANGLYEISGDAFVSPSDPCIAEGTCPPVEIDRGELLNEVGIGALVSTASDSFTFGFMPTRYLGGASSGTITFDIIQYLSYKPTAATFPFFQHALYPATPFIEDVPVKSIGLATPGAVGGELIYESGAERIAETVTTTSSADLRREIRRNVATLTRNMTSCDLDTIITPLVTVASSCISVDTQNNTVVAFYSGNPGDIVTLGGTGDIEIPDGYRYTIILQGVDLSITENTFYPLVPPGNPGTSFGIIVMQDEDGNGGNVFLSPNPTNFVGLLYAEGSLLSRSDAGLFYYGGGGSLTDLGNQTYWLGAIAIKNTIGGSSSLVVPEDLDCSLWPDATSCYDCDDWPDPASCAQAFDLDFVRRFTTINDSGTEYAPVTSLFSGGGSCVEAPAINCTLPGTLPSTVALTGGLTGTIDVASSVSLDAFYIEHDNRPVPPGFSSKGGLTSTTEIR